jgi:uncharacterized protein GlcG (DUF336 family)
VAFYIREDTNENSYFFDRKHWTLENQNHYKMGDIMWKKIYQIGLITGLSFFISLSFAQQAPSANPMDDIPDAMPFDIPYGMAISLEKADQMVNAVMAEAKKRNWKMNIAVVDPSGALISFKRMDGAQLASIAIAEHKARVAARFRRDTKLLENAVNVAKLNYVLTLDDVIASRGGIPLVEGGKLVGAIGCSGGTGSQDELVCKVGAAMINK